MNFANSYPQRVDTLIVNDETEEPSLLNAATGQILITNTVGKRIIELSDGSRDVVTIAETLVGEYTGAEAGRALEHTRAFLADSANKGIVTWA